VVPLATVVAGALVDADATGDVDFVVGCCFVNVMVDGKLLLDGVVVDVKREDLATAGFGGKLLVEVGGNGDIGSLTFGDGAGLALFLVLEDTAAKTE